MREKLLASLTVVVTLLIGALLLEAALRFLPVATGLFAQPVNAETPVFRFQADRSYTYSKGWDFAVSNVGWVNNAAKWHNPNIHTTEWYDRKAEMKMMGRRCKIQTDKYARLLNDRRQLQKYGIETIHNTIDLHQAIDNIEYLDEESKQLFKKMWREEQPCTSKN